jgi:ubiquinone/menaquinone biosynthesis C-methylase UbiE
VHKRFSDKLAFALNNPIRRILSPPTRLLGKLDIAPSSVVLDFGCGPGFFLIPIAEIAAKTIGVDVSPRMLKKSADQANKNGVNVELLESDGTDIPLPDNSVDLILLVHVFHEVNNKDRVLDEFSRTLRPSGRVAIVERTAQGGVLPCKFGPPVVNESEIREQIRKSRFTLKNSIPNGKDTVFILQN